MKYLLKNRDRVVLSFEVICEVEEIRGLEKKFVYLDSVDIINADILPIEIKATSPKSSLEKWIKDRKIPKNREFVNEILASSKILKSDNFMAYIEVSLGLSLNDTFWVVPDGQNYRWRDYNLYQNPFNETLALVAFTGISAKIEGLVTSPELTTNGMLKKCWHSEGGNIYLYKGSSQNGREAFCEFYMAQIAKAMEFNAISYDLKEFRGEIISSCRLFTSQDYGYLPIYYCLNESDKKIDKLRLMQKIESIYGKEPFEDLMLFDAIICNTDRHLSNYGMLINNETQEILRPAPIFDNGAGFLNYALKAKTTIEAIIENEMSWFNLDFDEQARLFATQRHLENLEKLANFSFIKHEKYNLDENYLSKAEQFIRLRSQKIIQIVKEKSKSGNLIITIENSPKIYKKRKR